MANNETVPAVSDEMLAAWRAEGERGPASDDGMTLAEIAYEWGVKPKTVSKRIYAGVKEGRYLRGTGYRLTATSKRSPRPVYRINPDFKEK